MKSISILLFTTILLLATVNAVHAYKTVQFVSEFGGKGEALGKFSDQTRLVFDKDDNIYVVDTVNRRVQKLDADGRPVMEITANQEAANTDINNRETKIGINLRHNEQADI